MASTILVVDDEKFIVEAITQHLSESGYEVQGSTDSTKALELIQNEDFDLVLTDLRMPNVSGMDITRAVQAKNTDALVIILTGYATLDTAIESVSLNVYAYLNKPFELRELGRVVDQALTTQRLERENEALRIRVTKMLQDITTLYEVTRFLYDTEDWAIIMEFVLDTLSIGLGISHSCLILKTEDNGYVLGKGNFPDGSALADRAAKYKWDPLESEVSLTEPTLVQAGGKNSRIFKQLSSSDEPLRGILFTPIRYRELLLGFLVVFFAGDTREISEDKRTLLQILAIQIAPQAYQSRGEPAAESSAAWYAEARDVLKRQIDAAESPDGRLGVNLLRFVTPRKLTSQEEIEAFHQRCYDLLLKHEPEARLHWLVADTALAFFPGSNQVQSEITCMALAEDFRTSELDELKAEGVAELISASASWPHNIPSTSEFLAEVWARLINQVHQYASRHGDGDSSNG